MWTYIQESFNLKPRLISVNKIQELPEEFGAIPKLKFLDLSCNDLDHLPSSFFNLSTYHTMADSDSIFIVFGSHTQSVAPVG